MAIGHTALAIVCGVPVFDRMFRKGPRVVIAKLGFTSTSEADGSPWHRPPDECPDERSQPVRRHARVVNDKALARRVRQGMQDSSGVEPRSGQGNGSNPPAPDLVDWILERDRQQVVEICDVFRRVARLGGIGLEDECELNRGHADHEIKSSSVHQNHANIEDERINRKSEPQSWSRIKSAAADGSRLEPRTIGRNQNVNLEITLHIVIAGRVRVTRIDQGAMNSTGGCDGCRHSRIRVGRPAVDGPTHRESGKQQTCHVAADNADIVDLFRDLGNIRESAEGRVVRVRRRHTLSGADSWE